MSVQAALRDDDAATVMTDTAVTELVTQAEALREQVEHATNDTCCGRWGVVGMRGIRYVKRLILLHEKARSVTSHCSVGRQRRQRRWRIKGRGYCRAHAVLGMHIMVPTTFQRAQAITRSPPRLSVCGVAPHATVQATPVALGACQ